MRSLQTLSVSLRMVRSPSQCSTAAYSIRRAHLKQSLSDRSTFYIRAFSKVAASRKNEPDIAPNTSKSASIVEGPKPESLKIPTGAATTPANAQDVFLKEKVVSTAEQRKADWAIMKEMTRYLWPKVNILLIHTTRTNFLKDNLGTRLRVGLSVGLLIGAKVRIQQVKRGNQILTM